MVEPWRPSNADELKEVIAGAVAQERAVEVLGAGSKRAFGRPVETEAAVAVERLSGIELYEPEELVLIARAGTPLAEIEARLAENQQELAFEPADYGAILGGEPGRATMGGVLSCNLSGPRRIKSGAARDHFLGVQAVTGRGDLIRAGGRVMKNVTGYDLCKLLCGSFGTLAVMTEVAVKVLPAAEERLTLALGCGERAAGFGALRTALASAYDVSGAAFVPPAAARRATPELPEAEAGVALLRLEGAGPSVRYRAEQLQALLGGGAAIEVVDSASSITLWRQIRDLEPLPRAGALWRLSVAPASAPELLVALEAYGLPLDWLADWGGGLLWVVVPEAEDARAQSIRAAVAARGGHATLVRAGRKLRARVDVFPPQAEPLARLSARVKASFDPANILNPHRMAAPAT